MKMILLSFSARKDDGNCVGIFRLVEELLKTYGHECSVLKLVDFNVKPCKGCDYECFKKDSVCPIQDDVVDIYNKIADCTHVVMLVPVYSAAPPSLYFALRERAQAVFRCKELYERFKKVKKSYIVIGNKCAGADLAISNLLEVEDGNLTENILLIQSRDHGQRSTLGKLAECEGVQEQVKIFVDQVVR